MREDIKWCIMYNGLVAFIIGLDIVEIEYCGSFDWTYGDIRL